MTTSIGLYGASDDLATIELDGKAYDEQGSKADYVFTADGKSLMVHIEHGRGGWAITTRIEDDSEEGDLPFSVALVQHDYSPKLVVTAKDKPVTFIWFDHDEDERVTNTKVFGPAALPSGSAEEPK